MIESESGFDRVPVEVVDSWRPRNLILEHPRLNFDTEQERLQSVGGAKGVRMTSFKGTGSIYATCKTVSRSRCWSIILA